MRYLVLILLLLLIGGCGKEDKGVAPNPLQGPKGDKGDPGLSPSSNDIAEAFSACPNIATPYREVLLRLNNGQLLASFSDNINGYNTRFVLIPDGTYTNSDGSGCTFTVSTSGLTRTIAWAGGSKHWSIQ